MTINNLKNIYNSFTDYSLDDVFSSSLKNFYLNIAHNIPIKLEPCNFIIIPSYNKTFTVFTLHEVKNVLEVAYTIDKSHLDKITYALRYLRKTYYSTMLNTIIMTSYFIEFFYDKLYIIMTI